MYVSKFPLLSSALLGLTVASSAAFAGHTGGTKAVGADGSGQSPTGHYRPAVYRISGAYGA